MLMKEKRSLRLAGRSSSGITSVCLEEPFWRLLERMADEAGKTVPQLIAHIDNVFHKEVYSGGDIVTLSSCLRVSCLQWLQERATRIDSDQDNPLAGLSTYQQIQ